MAVNTRKMVCFVTVLTHQFNRESIGHLGFSYGEPRDLHERKLDHLQISGMRKLHLFRNILEVETCKKADS